MILPKEAEEQYGDFNKAEAAIGTFLATLTDVTSAFFEGRYDLCIQRFMDAWGSFPGLLLLLTIMSLRGPGLFTVMAVFGCNMFGDALRGLLDPRLCGGR